MMYADKFPARLREARERAGLSQTAFAQMIDHEQPQVSRWERGVGRMNVDLILTTCEILHISADWLIGRLD